MDRRELIKSIGAALFGLPFAKNALTKERPEISEPAPELTPEEIECTYPLPRQCKPQEMVEINEVSAASIPITILHPDGRDTYEFNDSIPLNATVYGYDKNMNEVFFETDSLELVEKMIAKGEKRRGISTR